MSAYPPQTARPADVVSDGLTYVWNYDCTHSRSLWNVWKTSGWASGLTYFVGYACRWPDQTFTQLPKLPDDPETWLLENTKRPECT